MATATKTARTMKSSAAVTAGATAALTEVDLSTAFGGTLVVRITNGATGPTTDTTITIYAGHATTVERIFAEAVAGQTNNGVYDLVFQIPSSVMFVGGDIVAGASNNITAEAYLQELTSVG
jgi:hypothetical protein